MANYVRTRALIGQQDLNLGNPLSTYTRTTSTGGTQSLNLIGSLSQKLVVATDFAGADIGAQINAAITALGAPGGQIFVPSGSYTLTTQVTVINNPNIQIQGEGAANTIITAGASFNNDMFRVRMNAINSIGPNQNFFFDGIQLIGNSQALCTGIHIGDGIGYRISNCIFNGFLGTSGVCIWWDNTNLSGSNLWCERIYMEHVDMSNSTLAMLYTNSDGAAASQSFAYGKYFGIWGTQTNFIQIGTGVVIWGNHFNIGGNLGGNIFRLVGTAQLIESDLSVLFEADGGTCNVFNLDSGAAAVVYGMVRATNTGTLNYWNGVGNFALLQVGIHNTVSGSSFAAFNSGDLNRLVAVDDAGTTLLAGSNVIQAVEANFANSRGQMLILFNNCNSDGRAAFRILAGNSATFATGTEVARIDSNGRLMIAGSTAPTVGAGQLGLSAATQTTIGGAGGASVLPASPLGYILINVAGVAAAIPFYKPS